MWVCMMSDIAIRVLNASATERTPMASHSHPPVGLSRRDFVASAMAAGVGTLASHTVAEGPPVNRGPNVGKQSI